MSAVRNSTPQFDVGDAVVDTQIDSDDRGLAYVLDPEVGQADEVEVSRGRTVADFAGNGRYSSCERVVRVVYHETLKRRGFDTDAIAAARTDPDDTLPAAIDRHCREWKVSVRRYDYPEARLEAIAADADATSESTPATDTA